MGTVRAGTLDGSLRPRVVGLAESLPGTAWFAFLLETGRVSFVEEDSPIAGPVLAWRPWTRDDRATFAAGATGSYVVLGAAALANAVGYTPETRELREMADRTVVAPLSERQLGFQALRFAFHGLHRELGSDGVAARAVVDAYLRVILVEVYRAGLPQMKGGERLAPSQRTFTRFSQLVEAHFRDRWTVTAYAGALGMSRDRLCDICQRERGIGPKELIDRRVTVEARLQLENSSHSIQQIASLLGFSSPPQFTRFFDRTMGMPPGIYRKRNQRGTETGTTEFAMPYEWP